MSSPDILWSLLKHLNFTIGKTPSSDILILNPTQSSGRCHILWTSLGYLHTSCDCHPKPIWVCLGLFSAWVLHSSLSSFVNLISETMRDMWPYFSASNPHWHEFYSPLHSFHLCLHSNILHFVFPAFVFGKYAVMFLAYFLPPFT